MLGARLRELRKSKKMTMREFGAKFNLAESTISGYENGTRKPDIDQVRKFADYFEVTTDYLLGRSDKPDKTEDEEFHAFTNDPELNHFFRDIKASEEQEQHELKQIWEIIKQRRKDK